MLLAAVVLMPDDYRRLGRSAMAQAFAVSNVYFYGDVDYFAGAARTKPLLHTWSLAVEEQFYLVLPPLLMLLVGRWRLARTRLAIALAALAAASFVWSVATLSRDPQAAFFLLPSRAWEMLLGSLLATVPAATLDAIPRRIRSLLGAIGFALVAGSIAALTEATPFPGPAALPAVLGTVLIIASGGCSRSVNAVLSSRPLVGLGLISYSLYLWHWPLIALAECYWAPLPATGLTLAVAASLAAALLSWRFVEQPIRHPQPGRSLSPGRFVWRVVQVQTAVIAIGGSLDLTHGLPSRMPPAIAEAAAFEKGHTVTTEQVLAGELASLGVDDPAVRPTFLLWGDSHAMAVSGLIDAMARERGLRGYAAIKSHNSSHLIALPGEGEIAARNAAVERLIAAHNLTDVLLVERWEMSLAYRPGAVWLGKPGDRPRLSDSEIAAADRVLPELCERLGRLGCRVHLLAQIPLAGTDDGLFSMRVARAIREGFAIDGLPRAELDAIAASNWRPTLESLAKRPHVRLIDATDRFFDGDRATVFVDGRCCYRDDNHLNPYGAERLLRPELAPLFDGWRRIARQPRPLQTAAGVGPIVR